MAKHPGLTTRKLAKKLKMTDGQVAGHLNLMEQMELATRVKVDGVSTWFVGTGKDSKFAEVTYVGNHDYRVYLLDEDKDIAERLAVYLRQVAPELKYARAFTEAVRVPVRRNHLTKIGE